MSFPTAIQAITISQTGGIEVIEKTSQPFPTISPDHIVVQVQYAGVNFIDTYFRQGLYPFKSLPAILGMEIAGVIVGLPTDKNVLENEEYKKRGYREGGKVAVYTQGAHAEYVSAPWKFVVPVPDAVPAMVAGASLVQTFTGISFMDEAYNVQRGDIVLVHTVAGGVGLIFAQYAKYKGAIVIGTTSTSEKAELAKANGADHMILYKEEDTVQRVLDITNGAGVHAIFDGVGKDTFENNFKMIKRKGTIVSYGNASGVVPPFSPLKLVDKNVKFVRPMMGNYAFTAEEITHYGSKAFNLIVDGVLKVKIFQEYPFTAEGSQQTQRDLTSGKTVGKVVIKISD